MSALEHAAGGAIAERNPQQELINGVRSDRFREQIQLALPPGVTVDGFIRRAITAVQASPDIATADRDSVVRSLIQSAQMGLYPDGREAAIVIYNTKVGDGWVKKAQLIPMIGGYRKIAGEHGWTIRTQVVYANDHFEWEEGLNERLEHRPTRPGMERGELVAAYAIGVHRDGRREFQVFTAADVERAKSASRAAAKGPWVDWTDRMWEKTAGRRLFSKLPLAGEQRAVRMIEIDARAPGEALHALYGPARPALSEGSPDAAAEIGPIPASDPDYPDNDLGDEEIDWPGEPPADEPTANGDAAEVEALAAALFNPDSKQWPDMNLGSIWASDNQQKARSYFAFSIKNAKRPDFIEALRAFVGFYDPELYQQAVAEAEVGS